jgi:DNA-binding CsgD family transcriptional regulator/tetratricopeptide (TPR) repeat protein
MSHTAERTGPELLQSGWEALAHGAWDKAHACFTAAVNYAATAEALEGLGFAAWWLNETAETFRVREEAYRRYHEQEDRRGAARVATWLAMDHFTRRGEHAIASGWMQRAYRLLDELDPGPEHVLVMAWDAHMAILVEHDAAKASRLGAEAAALARSLGNIDLAMLAQACEGFAWVCAGEIATGMRLLDEATLAAVNGEMSDIDAITMTCCYLIYACERVRDVERAAQWCDKLRQITIAWSYHAMFAFCRTHYAGVLMARGEWAQAESELTTAIEVLGGTHPALAVEGIVRLAELRRLQGRLGEAATLFARLEEHPLRMLGSTPALLGRAALALDQGAPVVAIDLAERYLRAIQPEDRTARATGLELLVRAQAAHGDHHAAAGSLREVVAISTLVPTLPLRAAASFSAGTVAVGNGDYKEARQRFEDAVDLFERSGAPYEASRSRLELASVLAGLGRTEAAAAEAIVARDTLRRLGAAREADRATALTHQRTEDRDGRVRRLGPAPALTAREREVLRLVAQGLSDKEMAAALGLSEHTVHRHVANILTKLDLPSRAAAVARAAHHGVL